jgi:hypothetical protein
MFAAMGAMLVASLAVPDVFGDDALLFACAYAFVRIAHLVLYTVAGWGDRDLLGAVARLGVGTTIGVGLLFVAAALDGPAQLTVWAVALVIDMLGAYIGGGKGWRLAPGHYSIAPMWSVRGRASRRKEVAVVSPVTVTTDRRPAGSVHYSCSRRAAE